MGTYSNLQNATVLRGKKSSDVLQAFVECSATLYIDYPGIIRLDQKSGFTAASIRDLAIALGIILQFFAAQSHKSIGSVENIMNPYGEYFPF